MLQQENPDDYVMAVGRDHSVKDVVETAFRYAGLNRQEHIVIDEMIYRPAEVNILKGDFSKAKRKLDWKPNVTFDDLIKMMVESDIDFLTKQNTINATDSMGRLATV